MAKFLGDIAERFELPAEALAGAPRLTLTGEVRVMIENHRGLLEYSEELVEINAGRLRYRVRGDGLRLLAMDRQTLIITGKIFGIDTG